MQILSNGDVLNNPDSRFDLWVGYNKFPENGVEHNGCYFITDDAGAGSSKRLDLIKYRLVLDEVDIHANSLIIAMNGHLPQETTTVLIDENDGRLKYIDGCSDTVMIYPPKNGNPCINYLYMPPNTDQTRHTHPSPRIGMVVGGSGMAHVWNRSDEDPTKIPLHKGVAFYLPTNELHCFKTGDKEELKIVVFHPDSDWGPTDEIHPMINRTII